MSRGITPLEMIGPGADKIPVYGRNFVRNVYDATTGNIMH
jgi:hypothetical protein